MEELKPCPFCGCKELQFETIKLPPIIENPWIQRIFCGKCNLTMVGFGGGQKIHKKKLIAAWNKRC